jgi:hypothetical protein
MDLESKPNPESHPTQLPDDRDLYHKTAKEIVSDDSSVEVTHSTINDVSDMKRMGKAQQLRVRFSLAQA